jgi:hypothetical protein
LNSVPKMVDLMGLAADQNAQNWQQPIIPKIRLAFRGAKTVPSKAWVFGRRERCRNRGRVERWRGGLGVAYLCPALSFAGASLAAPCSVSTSRSSNRACEFPAHGSPTGFSRQHTMALSRSGRDPANIAIFAGK